MPILKKISYLLTSLMLLLCCTSIDLNPFVSSDVKEGYKLARVYCQQCHRYPEPELLDKKTWEGYVLPKMGALLGFGRFPTGGYFEGGKEVMKLDEWKKILLYYISQSHEEMVQQKRNSIGLQTGIFNVHTPAFAIQKPSTTMVHISEAGRMFFGDGLTGKVYALDTKLIVTDSFTVSRGIAHLQINANGLMALSMGVLHPSDEKSGRLEILHPKDDRVSILLDSLQRPVHASYADLNADGKEDIIVCEFGNHTGMLSWYENQDSTTYSKHILRALPGAVRTQVTDLNNDGRPDIIALMAQGDEGMFIYYNQGKGSFREQRILQFPPSYGSNYFDLVDMNKDGHPDILATNGDNGDYPPVLKPYHGIRIYLNDGKNNFNEETFLPMNGAGKAVARDFDGDGDLDIASISYFPDYANSPGEGFLYWENEGGTHFKPSSIKEVNAGRWLTMDAGDVDGDGDPDIILGNSFFSLGNVPEHLKKQWKKFTPSVLVLQNNQR